MNQRANHEANSCTGVRLIAHVAEGETRTIDGMFTETIKLITGPF